MIIIMNGNVNCGPDNNMQGPDEVNMPPAHNFCRDYIRGCCLRENCRFIHEIPPKACLKELFRFCHDFQNKGCFRSNCKFIHSTVEDEDKFYATGQFPLDPRPIPICQAFIHGNCNNLDCKYKHLVEIPGKEMLTVINQPPPQFCRPLHNMMREEDSPPEAKFRRYTIEENGIEKQILPPTNLCPNCDSLDHKVKLLHDNISVLLKKVADLSEKNVQLTSMNEFLLGQTSSLRNEHSCVITSRHGTSAPVSLATVSVTPVVSLAGALPTLVPAATPSLTLAPAASRAQLLTPAPQILTVSTTQQLMGNSGALIVTSAGAQQLMQVSDSGTLMGAGQTVVAVTPAQLTLAGPPQQLMSSNPQAVQQLVQQSVLQSQLNSQHQSAQYAAAQQSVQHLAAQQSAQHLAAQESVQHLAAQQSAQLAAQQSAQRLVAQQSAQHLAAQQSAQHLAAQQSAQHMAAQQSAQQLAAQQSAQQLAAQQSAQQQMVPSAQQLVHQTSTQQITISSTSQPLALPNSQAQPITFPIISQSILPH